MKITSSISILPSLVLLASGFKADVDGLYEVKINSAGEIIGDGLLIENATSTANTLSRRGIPSPQTNCLGYGINGGNYQVAFNAMGQWCDAGNRIPVGRAMIYTAGASGVIICNHASGTQPCGSGENYQFTTLLDISCGEAGAGWVWVGDWAKSFGRDAKDTIRCH